MPGAGDGEGDPGDLEVGEQPFPIRAECGTRPFELAVVTVEAAVGRFAQVHVVGSEGDHGAFGRQALEALLGSGAPVLADHQSPARAHRDVVGHVEDHPAGGLEEERQLLFGGDVAPDLARGRVAAALGREIDLPLGKPAAFEAREHRRLLGIALPKAAVAPAPVVGVHDLRVFDVDPGDVEGLSGLQPLDEVLRALGLEHLDLAAGLKVPALGRDEAVEASLALILGHVDHARSRVERDGLVRESSHAL